MSEKFLWTKANTSLLVSLWSDKSVQKNLQDTPRNVAIWNGIARYMKKRGIDVSWLKCRQRMKRLVVRYRMIKRGAKLKPKNMADSFYKEIDLIMSPNENMPMKSDTSLCSSSLDISNEAKTSVEYLLQEPEYSPSRPRPRQRTGARARPRARHMHNQTLEFKESEDMEYIQSPSPKIEPGKCDSDNNPSTSPNNIKLVEVVINTQSVPVLGDQDTTYLNSTSHLAYANSTNDDNPSGDPNVDPNCLVKEAIANKSDLLAQVEATQRILEANRMQQKRLESRMDKIVGQLEQMSPATNQGIAKKLETKLDQILNKLDQIIPHANTRTSEHSLDKKMDVVLERLEHIIPCLEQYNSSVPNLVDKIDNMLSGLDKIAPYAYDLIEVNTDE